MKDRQSAENAIRTLYEQHAQDVYRYAKLTLGDSSVARDVVQEVFLRAFRSWNQFRDDATPKTWLLSIARNYMVDSLRKKRTERRIIADQIDSGTRVDHASSVETRMMLEEAIAQLKDTYRHVFVLRHVHQHSIEETAQILGITKGNVKTTDRRALAEMRKILGSGSKEVNQS